MLFLDDPKKLESHGLQFNFRAIRTSMRSFKRPKNHEDTATSDGQSVASERSSLPVGGLY